MSVTVVLPALPEADAKDEESNLRATRTPPHAFVYSIKSPQINCSCVLKMHELKVPYSLAWAIFCRNSVPHS